MVGKKIPGSVVFVAAILLAGGLFVAGNIGGVPNQEGAQSTDLQTTNAVGDKADAFFNDSYVHEIRLYFNDVNWYEILRNSHLNDPVDPYAPARFECDDTIINQVGVRFKGLSSFNSSVTKQPFLIDFNEYQEDSSVGSERDFLGLKKLNLNTCYSDDSMLREKLFLDFASKYVVVPRAVHTRLFVNDEYVGLYLAVEQVDQTFVESRFGGNENGNLYKVEAGFLNYLGSDAALYAGSYELKTNVVGGNWSDIIKLISTLNDSSASSWPSKLESILDVESTLNSLALLNVFSSLDSYLGTGRNYYLYHRSDTGQFTMLICDFNTAFGCFGASALQSQTALDPFYIQPTSESQDGAAATDWLGGVRADAAGNFASGEPVLINRVLAVDSYNNTYLRAVGQVVQESFNAASIRARIEELANVVHEDVVAEITRREVDGSGTATAEQKFKNAITELVTFVEQRCSFLGQRLNGFAQSANLKLNDLMTTNTRTVSDDAGRYLPWVELYNMGPGIISTAGFFLTDDSNAPDEWALPQKDLPDGAYLLLWCGESGIEQNSAFSLDISGGSLFLYKQTRSEFELIDSVRYPVLDPDVSLSRYPDGEGDWFRIADYASPGVSNEAHEGANLVPANLFINELMADNDRAVESPYGTHPDWIELFNNGENLVDLSDMYLTDNLAAPKWQFPQGTVIEPGGYLLVWADFDSGRGSLHTNFNLRANGGILGLLASDGKTVIDFVLYDKQIRDVSYGRTPDGSLSLNFMTHPTAGEANVENRSVPMSNAWAGLLFVGLIVGVCVVLVFKGRIPLRRTK